MSFPQTGIPIFPHKEMRGIGALKFRDTFSDSSQHWAWRKFLGELSEVGKHGIEENGYYELCVEATKDGRWDTDDNEAPRLYIGTPNFPCEFKTKLVYFSDAEDSCAGLFISKAPNNWGVDIHFAIVRKNTAATNGIAVVKDAQTLASFTDPISRTLPVWFRIRLGCLAYDSLHIYFDYSHDGVNWTELYSETTSILYFTTSGAGMGLYVNNFTSFAGVLGRFDFFEMKPVKHN